MLLKIRSLAITSHDRRPNNSFKPKPLRGSAQFKRQAPMRTLLTLLFLIAITPAALAKCAPRFYVVSGLVLDANGAPAAGALVGVSWTEQSEPSGPALALSDKDGHYSIPILVSTYSGQSVLGDQCNGVLKEVSVSAFTATHQSEFEQVPVGTTSQVGVRPVRIKWSIEREPVWPSEVGR